MILAAAILGLTVPAYTFAHSNVEVKVVLRGDADAKALFETLDLKAADTELGVEKSYETADRVVRVTCLRSLGRAAQPRYAYPYECTVVVDSSQKQDVMTSVTVEAGRVTAEMGNVDDSRNLFRALKSDSGTPGLRSYKARDEKVELACVALPPINGEPPVGCRVVIGLQ